MICSGITTAQLPAFPGAEGFGKYTTGGRGGKVIYVTNLEDNTLPGSLRYAVNQTGARIVVFAVSGTIQLKSVLNIRNANITIAGQTAPGDGITLRDYTVYNDADNVIIRYIRFRMGDETNQENDAIWGRNRKNIIIDHCTMSWNTDECASFYDNENFTMQWCLLSESLRNSVHGKGAHGYGGIWGGRKASFHHNLLSSHDSRNPRFCGSRYSNKPDLELVDFRNNVIYNWGSNNAYAAEGGSYNMVNNYYKAGPATSSSSRSRFLQPYADDGSNNQPKGTYGKFYIDGNYTTGSAVVSGDNWLGVALHSSFATNAPGITKNDIKSDTEFLASNVTTHSAQNAYLKVLDYAGASLVRDVVDQRIIQDATTGTATFMTGGNGSINGLIDTQSAVGGWPELKTLPAPFDSDGDGMPDAWEDANGLQKNDPSDAQLNSVDGKYPNVEVYINSLVSTITENQLKDALFSSLSPDRKTIQPIEIYYNGNTGLLKINHQQKIKMVQVYSLTGQLLSSQMFLANSVEMQIQQRQKGILIVKIYDENNTTYSRKVHHF
jgi:pectate lyase